MKTSVRLITGTFVAIMSFGAAFGPAYAQANCPGVGGGAMTSSSLDDSGSNGKRGTGTNGRIYGKTPTEIINTLKSRGIYAKSVETGGSGSVIATVVDKNCKSSTLVLNGRTLKPVR